MKVTLFIPCFVDQLYPRAGMAMVRVLERLGHTVDFRENLTCCGQPPFNAGYWDEARSVAARVVQELADAEVVVIGSGSCGAMLRVFNLELFAGTPQAEAAGALSQRTFEFSEFIVNKLGLSDVGARFEAAVTFHDGCHGLRELRIKDAPRELLRNVRGLKLLEMEDAETCCGFGGTFSVKFPAVSVGMGDTKLVHARTTEAKYLVSNDLSCLMHLSGLAAKQGRPIKALHLAEVLDSR